MKIKKLTGTMNPSKSRATDVFVPATPIGHGAGASGETDDKAIKPSFEVAPIFTRNKFESNFGTLGSSGTTFKGIQIAIDVGHLLNSSRHLLAEHMEKIDDCSVEPCADGLSEQRSIITFSLNVPGDLVGDTPEFGTSVFAMGVAALKIACAQLASLGIPREELDRLTTANVSIQKVVVPYLFKFSSEAETATFSSAVTHRALAVGLNIRHVSVVARIVEYREQCALQKTDGNSAAQQTHEASLVKTTYPSLKLVRIDLELGSEYLNGCGWTLLDSWRNAYAEGRYLTIFNKNVRELFRLNTRYRIQTPSAALFERLSTIAQGMLRNYVERKDPDTCGRFPSGGKWGRANKKEQKVIREEILNELGIDILIPWAQFRNQPHLLLAHKLGYPGDFQPPPENAHSFFCKDNWPRLLAALRELVEGALASQWKLPHNSQG